MSTVIVAIAKNEQDYIEEWVIYHLALGFDKIYLYDNEDEQTYSKILEKYENRVVNIHLPGNNFKVGVQYVALSHFMSEVVKEENIKYALHSDIDEFVCFKKHKNIKEFVNEYFFNPVVAGVGISWRFFGSSGFIKKTNEPVVERFTRCAAVGNELGKTIFDVNLINGFVTCHNPFPKEGYHIIDTNGLITSPMAENPQPDISVIQLNHYYCKTIPEFFYAKSRGRADVSGGAKGTYGGSEQKPLDIHLINLYLQNNHNEEEDLTACNFYKNIKSEASENL
jgi:hypothetical protein